MTTSSSTRAPISQSDRGMIGDSPVRSFDDWHAGARAKARKSLEREKNWKKFKDEQRMISEWISFDRAVICITDQKNLSATQAATMLRKDLRGGKFHRQNPEAVRGFEGDFWSAKDCKLIKNDELVPSEPLPLYLDEIHFDRSALLAYLREYKFVVNANIMGRTLSFPPDFFRKNKGGPQWKGFLDAVLNNSDDWKGKQNQERDRMICAHLKTQSLTVTERTIRTYFKKLEKLTAELPATPSSTE